MEPVSKLNQSHNDSSAHGMLDEQLPHEPQSSNLPIKKKMKSKKSPKKKSKQKSEKDKTKKRNAEAREELGLEVMGPTGLDFKHRDLSRGRPNQKNDLEPRNKKLDSFEVMENNGEITQKKVSSILMKPVKLKKNVSISLQILS